jgi:sec-independent protein translocase protein TatA
MNLLAMENMLGTVTAWHVVIALVVVLLLFGGKKLPELARGLAKGLRIFKEELHGLGSDLDKPPADQQANKPTDNPTDKPPFLDKPPETKV